MEMMKTNDTIDAILRLNERELTMLDVARVLCTGKRDFMFNGVIYRYDNQIVDRGERPFADSLSFLQDSLEIYRTLPLQKYDTAYILTGRGCPFSCTFCNFQKTKPRKRDIEVILKEVKYLSQYYNVINFLDLNFSAKKEWAQDLLSQLSRADITSQFTTDCRIEDFHDLPLLKLFKKANFAMLIVGMEHVSSTILKSINKYFETGYLAQGIRNCKKAGIMPMVSFMIGFPEESKGTIDELDSFIQENQFFMYSVNTLILNPRTSLFERYRKNGLVNDYSLKSVVVTAGFPPYRTENLTDRDLWNYCGVLNRHKKGFSFLVGCKISRLRCALSANSARAICRQLFA
jgi:radical SAM superfamily enzyme YgiQ (UPF0313 family)